MTSPVEVGQGHIGVNGIVKDKGRGEAEEENCQGEGGRTEERNIWYLVRCYTVRGQWHIINRIWLACMILYTVHCSAYYTLYLVMF